MRKPPLKPDAQGQTGTKLLVAMTGKASAARAAEGDEPVLAYIASLPQPQRSIAERVDALAANTLPNLQRAVKWGNGWTPSGLQNVTLKNVLAVTLRGIWSGRRDLNSGPLAPQASALARLRHGPKFLFYTAAGEFRLKSRGHPRGDRGEPPRAAMCENAEFAG